MIYDDILFVFVSTRAPPLSFFTRAWSNDVKSDLMAVYIEECNEIWYAENFSAYGVTFIFRRCPALFLEKELGMKRELDLYLC